MSKISCDVIGDLIPLYHDNICSCDSSELVENHIKECSKCKQEIDSLSLNLDVFKSNTHSENEDINVLKNISSMWKKGNRKSFIKGAITTSSVFATLVIVYIVIFMIPLINVPIESLEVESIGKYKDNLLYKLSMDSSISCGDINIDKDGNAYFPFKESISSKLSKNTDKTSIYYLTKLSNEEIKEKFAIDYKKENGKEVKAIYLGTPNENILIWKKGIELPSLSEDMINAISMY